MKNLVQPSLPKSIFLLFLLPFCLLSCNEDLIWADGRTVAKGYVVDEINGNKVPNALVYLYSCRRKFIGRDYCNDILDSTRTNSEGFYIFSFKDKKKEDFGIGLAYYPENNFHVSPLDTASKKNTYGDEPKIYEVKEGKINDFNFNIKVLTILKIHITMSDTIYNDISVHNRLAEFSSVESDVYIENNRHKLDTVVYLTSVPNEVNFISAVGRGENLKPKELRVEKSLGTSAINEVLLEF